ncbi:MraY family glycosyltransferase [Cellvibrio zantedeschiae]|uniref:MraY family glycosyltransferase n=1 Tax=Cellvibrio zantedeschiae TaxID=1237077 RepID=UPI00167C0273|nr:glycosyltransferase family 4 protein [Cellvibrio zantedeschiae]
MGLIIALFFILCIAGYFITRALISYAHKKQLLDVANHRSSHTQATPRIGGLSFVVLISLLVFTYALLNNKISTNILLFILLPIVLVALTGLVDDLKGLSQAARFIIYFFCSVVALGNLQSFFSQASWLIVLEGLLLSLSLSWLINLFNFMDGIDGIAASESIFVLAALAFFSYQGGEINLSYFLLLCTAPVIGFLALNWQPAKIFMGDIGSTFLGCLIGCLCLYAINTKLISICSVIILLGCFIVDASWTLAYRILSGQKWYLAHRSHHYQILSRKLGSHQKVSLRYSLVNLVWLLPLALTAFHYKEYALLITTISLLPLIWRCFIIGAGKSEQN